MKHRSLILPIAFVIAALLTGAATAAKTYATKPAYEPTVRAIATAIDKCVHTGAYIGPVKIKSITLLDASFARAELSLGVSGDSAATAILARGRANQWTCVGGGGGAINARNLAHVPSAERSTLLSGKNMQAILARPIYLAAPQKSIFVIQTPGH